MELSANYCKNKLSYNLVLINKTNISDMVRKLVIKGPGRVHKH